MAKKTVAKPKAVKKTAASNKTATKVVKTSKKTVVPKTEVTTKKPAYDLTEMLEAGVHFGHQSKRWHPKMQPYIWQSRDGVHIFDLIKTSQCLAQACEAVAQHMASGKTLAYVGTKRQAAGIVKEYAEKAECAYMVTRWAGGTITNWKQVVQSLKRLGELKQGLAEGKFDLYTKKERVLLDREMGRLERLFGGIAHLSSPPEALFIVDINREKTAIAEARRINIPIFAIVDSNSDPTLVDYPIPANDDAVRSLKLIISIFSEAVIKGKAKVGKKAPEKDTETKKSVSL